MTCLTSLRLRVLQHIVVEGAATARDVARNVPELRGNLRTAWRCCLALLRLGFIERLRLAEYRATAAGRRCASEVR